MSNKYTRKNIRSIHLVDYAFGKLSPDDRKNMSLFLADNEDYAEEVDDIMEYCFAKKLTREQYLKETRKDKQAFMASIPWYWRRRWGIIGMVGVLGIGIFVITEWIKPNETIKEIGLLSDDENPLISADSTMLNNGIKLLEKEEEKEVLEKPKVEDSIKEPKITPPKKPLKVTPPIDEKPVELVPEKEDTTILIVPEKPIAQPIATIDVAKEFKNVFRRLEPIAGGNSSLDSLETLLKNESYEEAIQLSKKAIENKGQPLAKWYFVIGLAQLDSCCEDKLSAKIYLQKASEEEGNLARKFRKSAKKLLNENKYWN